MEAPTIENKLIKILFNEFIIHSIPLYKIKKQTFLNSNKQNIFIQELDREKDLYLIANLFYSPVSAYEEIDISVVNGIPQYEHRLNMFSLFKLTDSGRYSVEPLEYNTTWTITNNKDLKLKYYKDNAFINPHPHDYNITLDQYLKLTQDVVKLIEDRTTVLLVLLTGEGEKVEFIEKLAIIEAVIVEDGYHIIGLQFLIDNLKNKKTLYFDDYMTNWLLILK